MCVCSLIYPIWKAHALYYVFICRLLGSTIFFHIISSTARFSKKMYWNVKCVFWFYLQFFSEIFFILRIIQRDVVINIHTSSCIMLIFVLCYIYICQILMDLNFLDGFSKKRKVQISNFIKIRQVGAEFFLMRTDGETWQVGSHFSELCHPF